MNGMERSLLTYLDTPVVIGDPAGAAVWANPAFETRFGVGPEELAEQPLAALFSGGSRERILHAVALVCAGGESERFRLREHGADYEAVVSGIEVGAECVGVVILLKETLEHLERLCALQRHLQEPLDEIELVLDLLLEQTGGRRSDRHRQRVEDALRALGRIRKWSEELGTLLSGGGAEVARERFDPVAALRRVVERSAGGATPLELLAPASLPALEGDSARFEWALARMVEVRLGAGAERLVLGARIAHGGGPLLLSLTEVAGGTPAPVSDPPDVRAVWAAFEARSHSVAQPRLGRVWLLALPVVESGGA